MRNSFKNHVVGILILFLWVPVYAGDVEREYQIKAAILYKLTRFVDWKNIAFKSEDSPINICLVNPDPFGDFIDKLIDGRRIGKQGRAIQVKRINNDVDISDCHIMFLHRSARFEKSFPRGTLLITEDRSLIDTPYHINLFNEEGNTKFEINITNLNKNEIKLSSMLLNLAIIVSNTAD